ncbi:NLPc/P60 superfamily protein [Eptesipox virus]|uniref:Protein OPG091 n=1 Tax=Eptesipox virus TaxID=1329402 RepID=A0A220T6C2_9POXV|nr:NLPc/P60 superfamily protein [Eptesipox virus]ASK51261.1 NLPc/P60 superfamily protein [Eptesipox virus]WAH71019.1 NLPc/P60 superfamily protein [Eptesipox virus]
MDPATFLKYYAPKGSIIFINYIFSLTEIFNPSEIKHAAIYYGNNHNTINILNNNNDDDYVAVEATFKNGVRCVPLSELLSEAVNVKVYSLKGNLSTERMTFAAEYAFKYLGIPYGFGSKSLYCFKLVADCYNAVHVNIPTYNILGKHIVLSQSFTKNNDWKKIYDSSNFMVNALSLMNR